MAGKRAVAVAGIARPERFFAAARAEGWDVVRELPYRDHHWFDARDITRITAAASETGADVILTTEKDAMRLDRGPQPFDELRVAPSTVEGQGSAPHASGAAPPVSGVAPVWAYLPMQMVIEPAAEFAAWLEQRLAACRAGS